MAYRSALDPPPPGSDSLTRSDFLPNAMSQLDADHFGLDKVKRRPTEYLAVVRLRALTAQEAKMEQVKAQEVVLKDAIEDQKDKDKTSEALVRAGETQSPRPTSIEIQVSPVSGIKEKVSCADRAGANRVVLPWATGKDVEHDVAKEVRARIQFVFARTVRNVATCSMLHLDLARRRGMRTRILLLKAGFRRWAES
jgi:ATP-dependent Lon protease